MDIDKLIEILLELRTASMQIHLKQSENEIKTVMNKYDMLFLGEKFNNIYSVELCHSMKNYFKVEIENNKLNELIPTICKSLNMKYEPLVAVSKLGKSTEPVGYNIILW